VAATGRIAMGCLRYTHAEARLAVGHYTEGTSVCVCADAGHARLVSTGCTALHAGCRVSPLLLQLARYTDF